MKLYYALIASLIFHLLSYNTLDKWSQFVAEAQKEPVEVIILEGDQEFRIIRQANTPEPDSTDPKDISNLLSEKNQRFKQQVQAKNIGKTANRGAPELSNEKAQEDFNKRLKSLSQLSDLVVQRYQKKANTQAGQKQKHNFDQSPLPSTINDPVNNVPVGNFSALNTNRYIFYSYFMRIEDQIRHRWVTKVREVIDRRPYIPFGERTKEIWNTEIEVLLDDEGNFVRADIFKTSGLENFDYAAIEAFRDGAPIPNPPEGLIQEDGMIHLHYAFNVYWRPRYY